jgi:Na+/pantothenate symporter
MTAFSILGASGHAFANGIVTFGLMASSSALVIPVCLFFIGTRLWALGKRHGFMTPVQMFRDRWECRHIGTVIFAVQAVLLVPYIIIAVMGGGTVLQAITNGYVPFWLGGAIVSSVVMAYVFLGGMRGTAWVNALQTTLFLLFGTIAVFVIGGGMGGFTEAMEALLASPATSPLLTRERISPWYFFSYTFIPLSSIAFPHICIFCMTAQNVRYFRKTIVLYPICMLLIWLPSVFLGVVANQATAVPAIQTKLEARAELASPNAVLTPTDRARLRAQAAGDDVILRLVDGYAPLWLAALLGAAVMAAVMASDSQILALSTMFTEDIFAFYQGTKRPATTAGVTGRLCRHRDGGGLFHRVQGMPQSISTSPPVCVCRLLRARAAVWRRSSGRTARGGSAGQHALDGGIGRGRRDRSECDSPAAAGIGHHGLGSRRSKHHHTRRHGHVRVRTASRRADDDHLGGIDDRGIARDEELCEAGRAHAPTVFRSVGSQEIRGSGGAAADAAFVASFRPRVVSTSIALGIACTLLEVSAFVKRRKYLV